MALLASSNDFNEAAIAEKNSPNGWAKLGIPLYLKLCKASRMGPEKMTAEKTGRGSPPSISSKCSDHNWACDVKHNVNIWALHCAQNNPTPT
jgi:hypothetical protein